MNRKKRSRDGCWTCRDRKKKCDAGGFPCGNCVRLNLDCRSGVRLVWEDDTKREGMRRRGPTKKATSSHSLIHSPQASQFPRLLDPLDMTLLDNYVQRFSRTYPTEAGPKNPFLSVLIPLALRSELVLDSLLCLSSAQQWNDTKEMTMKRLELRNKALRGCMSLLGSEEVRDAQPHQITTEPTQFNVLASVSLFLLYEKVMGDLSWRPHIEFMNQFFGKLNDLKGTNLSTSDSEALEFFHAIFTYNDLVQSTSSRGPMMSHFYTGGSYHSTWSEVIDSCESVISSQRYYFPSLISRITAGDESVTELEILLWDGSLNWLPSFALNRVQLGSKAQTATDDIREDTDRNHGKLISDLYRLAASIYRRQCAASYMHVCIALDTTTDISTEELASYALLQLPSLPEGSMYENALLWPLAIVASALTSDQVVERAAVLDRLQSLEARFGMRQFRRAQEVLSQHWMMQDSGQSTNALSTETILLG